MSQKSLLRKTEKLILSRLELNSRSPFSHFSGKIRKSQQLVSYTVASLIKKGIIRGFYTLIDYSKLNVLNFRVYFKLNYINKEKFDELTRFLVSDPHTSWVCACGGRYDLICTFLALNPSQFNKTLRRIMEEFPEQLQNYVVLTTIVNHDFGRKYLFRETSMIHPHIIFGGDRMPEDIDDIDMKILDELSDDARKNSAVISNRISFTPKSVIHRIKKLRKRNMIKGFKPVIDPESMGYTTDLLLIKYHNISVGLEDKLIAYLKAHPNIVSLVKTLGMWDLEIRIETKNLIEFRRIEMELRQKFKSVIQQIESIPLYNSFKINYFPRFLMKAFSSKT
ncbi:Lrp/AsnC family transcriptional regulator [Candidatus Woesearchaeota archaeon]|nr:Lrp/AsnC family transcriptional regulator [Candidatus Woesearchaeota archaeon]